MSLSKLVVFDRPLLSATAVVKARMRSLTEAELQDLREQARREGAEDARRFADAQMVEMRTEVQQLNESLFEALRQTEARLSDQVRAALPGLAVEIALGQPSASGRQGIEIEHRADVGPFRAMADGSSVGPVAQQQADGIDQDRFAGPGFSGHGRHAAGQLQFQCFDDGEVVDA